MTQVRTRVGCKEPRRYDGSACHNSVAEEKFLSWIRTLCMSRWSKLKLPIETECLPAVLAAFCL